MTRKKVILKKKHKTIKKKSISYLNKKRKFTFRKAGSSSSNERKKKHIRRLLTKKKRILKIVDEPELEHVVVPKPVELVTTEDHPITTPSLEPENVETEEHPITTPSLEPVVQHPSISELPSLVPEKKETFLIRPKTLKKKLITDLKSSVQEQTTMSQGKRLNESFIDIMDQLSTIMLKQGEPFRAKAYQKAQETIMTYPNDITSVDQLKGLPGIGPTITEKLNEFVSTGTLKVIEREKTNPVNLLGDVYGIGPKKAKDLIEKGVSTIEQLRERQDELLNDTQKVGLKYYEDILERIPREEIDSYNTLFKEAFSAVSDTNSHYEIVGSYRRGAKSSGDIDVIITSASQVPFIKFVDSLVTSGVILEVLSRGPTKSHVIAKLEGRTHARRVDFLYTKPNEYAFSLLYFTGSKIFNTVMRGHALKMGYSLNEHGLSVMNGKVKGELVSQSFPDEQSIFAFLNMEYKAPTERIDGRAVIIKSDTGVKAADTVENAKEAATVENAKDAATVVNSVVNSVVSEPILDSMGAEKEEVVVKKVVKKNRSLKKRLVLKEEPAPVMKQEDIPSYVEQFKKEGISILEQLTEGELTDMLTQSRLAYFNITPIMTDNEYDILKEFMEKKFPQNKVLNEVGAAIEITKNKATLPYEMASMDKIKPDSGALDSWKKKYTGPYVLSGKADGVSGLYTTEGPVAKLYTRGNGVVGQDVSHLIPYLRLPTKSGLTVRGEFILSNKTCQEKYGG
jgi:DNA polymerase beta